MLRRGGLILQVAAFVPGADWLSDARDEEAVRLPAGGDIRHAFADT